MKHLVLAGAGHAHVQVLLGWVQQPQPGVTVTVVSPEPLAPYSGMVPGWLAGHYRYEQIGIDVPALCRRAGARWVQGSVARLDASRRQLWLDDGQSLHYDVLGLNIGSTLRPPVLPGCTVLPLRPLSQLHIGWNAVLNAWRLAAAADRQPLCVTAVGAGAAGFESVLAVVNRLRRLQPQRTVLARLVGRGGTWLPGVSSGARQRAARALESAGVALQLGSGFVAEPPAAPTLVLWATGAQAHEWLTDDERRGGLAVSADGFVRVDACLRSVSHPNVLAAGDCAHWDAAESAVAGGLPKAGVFAVRMGPLLLHNLRAALSAGEPRPYRPQRDFLVLLATGDGRAIASRNGLSAEGRWVGHWKHRVDQAFLDRFAPPRAGA
jgi:pyridine nucleotide-disulfide oxidoreductase family protein